MPSIMEKFISLTNKEEYRNDNHHCMIIGHFGENHSGEQLALKMERLGWRVCRVGLYTHINEHRIILDICLASLIGLNDLKNYKEHRKHIKVKNLLSIVDNPFDFILIMQNDLMFDLEGVETPVHYYHTEILHPYIPDGISNLIFAYPGGDMQLSRIFPTEIQKIKLKAYIPHAVNLEVFKANDMDDFKAWSERKILFGFRGIRRFTAIGDFMQDNLYNLRERFLPVAEEIGLDFPEKQMWTEEFANYMRSTKIALNIPGLYGGINQRMMEACASGCILLNYHVETMEEIGFIDGKTCYTFKDETELREKYQYIIEHPNEAYEVAKNGFNLVNNQHGYIHRALQFIVLHYTH